jgi:2-dehydropantoate 2-reductase
MTADRRWLVVGAGGIGGYFGGLLALSGQDVTFLARGDHLAAMHKNGLRIETVDRSYSIRPHALDSVDSEPHYDVVLFCVKTYDNVTAAKAIGKAVDDHTVILSIQNGMDNEKALGQLLPAAQVYPGLAHIVSARVAPGVIRQSGGARTILFGDPQNPTNPRLREIAEKMHRAQIDATASTNIERDRWDKFVFIVAFSGMTALCRSPIGEVLNDPLAMSLYRRCVAEAVAVAEAEGVDVDAETSETAIRRTEAYRGAQEKATSSMLRDLLAGRLTEIESLNGAVVRRADERNQDVPVNSMIYSAIKLATKK